MIETLIVAGVTNATPRTLESRRSNAPAVAFEALTIAEPVSPWPTQPGAARAHESQHTYGLNREEPTRLSVSADREAGRESSRAVIMPGTDDLGVAITGSSPGSRRNGACGGWGGGEKG